MRKVLIALAFIVVGLNAQEPKEVKPTELEAAKLVGYRAKLDKIDAQFALLQTQANQITNERQQVQTALDELTKTVIERFKKDEKLTVVYDPRTGDGGTFRVVPTPAAPTPKEETKK